MKGRGPRMYLVNGVSMLAATCWRKLLSLDIVRTLSRDLGPKRGHCCSTDS